MSERPEDPEENPLDDLAAELSENLTEKAVEISDSAQTHVEGGQVQMKQSAARTVQASALHMDESAAGLIRSGSVDIVDSAVGAVVARTMHLQETTTSLVVAQTVEASDVRTFFLLTSGARGNLTATLTPQTALFAGAGFGLMLWLLKWLSSRLLRAKGRK